MELRVLEYFLAVAREQNITKAAEQLQLTQPTLSRQLIELEEELKIYRQSPALAITEYKMKSYEDQINRLNIKIQSIQAETEKRDLRKLWA